MNNDQKMLNTKEHTEAHRKLSDPQIEGINKLKFLENSVGEQLNKMKNDPSVDPRLLAIARTELQKGFMFAVRAIAQPESAL